MINLNRLILSLWSVAIPLWICSQLMTSHQQKQNHQCAQIAPKKKKKALSIYNGQVNYLPIFFAFRYISGIYISRKKAICLGSITKCDVTRYGGGLQSRAKNKAPFEKLRLADFFHNGAMVLLEFRFLCVLGGRQTPQDGLQGVDWIKRRQPCKS